MHIIEPLKTFEFSSSYFKIDDLLINLHHYPHESNENFKHG